MSWGHLSISAISQLLLVRFGSNFKQRVLGTYYNRLQLSQRHLSMQHLSWGQLSISAISQLLLVRFGLNFKQRVLGTYRTDCNCHHDICPCNICPGDICPYQQYLSCYRPDFDQTLNKGSWEHVQQITTVTTTFVQATFVLGTIVHISNFSAFQAEHFRLQSCSCYM